MLNMADLAVRNLAAREAGSRQMDADTVIALVGGLGIGSLVATVIQHWLTQRSKVDDRRFVELREAFAGLLQSIAELDRVHSGDHPDDEKTRANVGLMHSVARIELVAPAEIVDLATGWRDGLLTDSGTGEELDRIMEELVLSMRKALGVAPGSPRRPA